MKKRGLLVVLVMIFLTACTFIEKENPPETSKDPEALLMNDFDRIVKKAAEFANLSESAEVQEVFQNKEDRIWKVQFTNGTILLYDEETDEFVHAE